MLREKIRQLIIQAIPEAKGINFDIGYPDSKFGDYSTNVAMVLRKDPNLIAEKIDKAMFEKVEVVKPGFINFRIKVDQLLKAPSSALRATSPARGEDKKKILLEYFQPNIAKPLHVGHLRTAIIGDAIKRMFLYQGYNVESDTHMGDWGTQFGYLILAYKKFGEVNDKLYAELNADESMREPAKQEFVKLEQGDKENRKIWEGLVEESTKEFLKINDLMDILPFDHNWPESFYEDKMPAVVESLKAKKLLKSSQGAQVVDLTEQGLGVAIIIKSDGGTTYLLRDLATFIFGKEQGFDQHLYVVDNRQALHYKQLFAILRLMRVMSDPSGPSPRRDLGHEIGDFGNGISKIPAQLDEISAGMGKGRILSGDGHTIHPEGVHISYGFISFKGEALSTRKGNMVLAADLIAQAEDRVAKIIQEKNPDLANKQDVVKAVAKAALKYFDLKHNRHSDIEFDWEQALDFEGNSGPYLQYTHARLCSIFRKSQKSKVKSQNVGISETEHRILFLSSILDEKIEEAMKDYLPNILANYFYELASEINKFYHESPVLQEKDEELKNFRLQLVVRAKETLAKGLDLLGIRALEEM